MLQPVPHVLSQPLTVSQHTERWNQLLLIEDFHIVMLSLVILQKSLNMFLKNPLKRLWTKQDER